VSFPTHRPFSADIFDPLHLKKRTDFEIQVNREYRLPTDIHLPPESWVLARRGVPTPLGADWKLSHNTAIGVISQLIWAAPERFYYKADGDRLAYTRDGTGFVIRREIEVRNCLIGMLDLREIDRRALGAGDERRGAIFMDLVDYWLRMDLRQQLCFIDRYHGTKNQ
jgi:hypothetical protein